MNGLNLKIRISIYLFIKGPSSCLKQINESKRIQRRRLHNTPEHLFRRLSKPIPQFLVSYDIACIGHLFQQLIQPPERSDNRALVGISHFAKLCECRSIAPFVAHFDQLLLDRFHILVLH
jgi:hypothetical protein